jgi:hypothetical protein
LRRWRAVIDAIGTFLDRWAAEAAALGWQATDIFGADAARPEVTWLNAGPLWSGDGARVIAVHADRIVFETKGRGRAHLGDPTCARERYLGSWRRERAGEAK